LGQNATFAEDAPGQQVYFGRLGCPDIEGSRTTQPLLEIDLQPWHPLSTLRRAANCVSAESNRTTDSSSSRSLNR
jgi:hypothetical protein